MATAVQRAKLLSISCPWCHAAAGEECTTGPVGKRRLITTLDGGCHDARWNAALGMSAEVVLDRESTGSVAPAADPGSRQPVSVGAAMDERPW